jgi:hypothetical protein
MERMSYFAEIADKITRLHQLVAKLLAELQQLIPDRADSNLPEWEREAEELGVKKNGEPFPR